MTTIEDREAALAKRGLDLAEISAPELSKNAFGPRMIWSTDDKMRLMMFCDPDFSKVAWAVGLLTSCSDADEIAFLSDTYAPKAPTKTNGQPWGRGELAHAFENKTEDAHLVSEALGVIFVDAGGWCSSVSIPYIRTGSGVVFVPEEGTVLIEDPSDMTTSVSGGLPSAMRDAMARERIREAQGGIMATVGEALGLTEVEARAHTLAMAVKMVLAQTQQVCAIGMDEEERAVFDRSFADTPFNAHHFDFSDGAPEPPTPPAPTWTRDA